MAALRLAYADERRLRAEAEGAVRGLRAAAAASEDAASCCVCMDAPRGALLHPCGHVIACVACATTLCGRPCPVCAAHVDAFVVASL